MNTLIVADDLSGAADCAVAFGGNAAVMFADAAPRRQVEVLAIDADTRAGDAARAARETARLFAGHARPGVLLFKKLDSTLRGHVGVEIAAAHAALGALDPAIIVAPAFPATGRSLRHGRLHLDGVPLEQSQLWRRQGMTGDADLVAILGRAGLDARLTAPEAMPAGGHVMVCDAQSDRDLDAIVAAGRKLARPVLWAGAGGLARALARARPRNGIARKPALAPVSGTILFLVGSNSTVSREQARQFARRPGTALIEVRPETLAQSPPRVAAAEAVLLLEGGHELAAGALARAFAGWAAPLALQADALFLTGGETAHAVLEALGAQGLRLAGEIAPGVTAGLAEGGSIGGRPVVIKAGGFGAPDILGRCRDVLRGVAGLSKIAP
jgi:4-hydroxythreonine-4-phosphate dehydrogenase